MEKDEVWGVEHPDGGFYLKIKKKSFIKTISSCFDYYRGFNYFCMESFRKIKMGGYDTPDLNKVKIKLPLIMRIYIDGILGDEYKRS